MTQTVNLYVQELRPHKERLQAGGALALLGLAVAMVLVIGGLLRFQNGEARDRLSALQQQNEKLEQTVAELSATVESRQPDPAVMEALERINHTISRRQRLLARVESLVLQGGEGFSSSMAALARRIPEGVWLTGIRLEASEGTVGFEGQARTADLVPVYLERLGQEPVFAGRTFGEFRLNRQQDSRGIAFTVATEHSGESQ